MRVETREFKVLTVAGSQLLLEQRPQVAQAAEFGGDNRVA
jgi:hypothetical protein